MAAYWALMSNPRGYRIEDATRELEIDSWETRGSQIQAGDRAIVWKALGGQEKHKRGIIALAEVISDPRLSRDLPGYTFSVDPIDIEQQEPAVRVDVRYVLSPKLPLWIGGDNDELLASLSVARAQGGTVFKVA